jgi:hypothetical protein
MSIDRVTKDELISFIENNTAIRIDSLIESAIETAEEVHERMTNHHFWKHMFGL